MMEIAALTAVSATPTVPIAAIVAQPVAPSAAAPTDFATLIADGMRSMDAKVARADHMVGQFALDDSIPLHQVTIALEEARLSVEFAMQVRQRFVEGYRELMNLQL